MTTTMEEVKQQEQMVEHQAEMTSHDSIWSDISAAAMSPQKHPLQKPLPDSLQDKAPNAMTITRASLIFFPQLVSSKSHP